MRGQRKRDGAGPALGIVTRCPRWRDHVGPHGEWDPRPVSACGCLVWTLKSDQTSDYGAIYLHFKKLFELVSITSPRIRGSGLLPLPARDMVVFFFFLLPEHVISKVNPLRRLAQGHGALEEGWQGSWLPFVLRPELAQPIPRLPHPFPEVSGFLPAASRPQGTQPDGNQGGISTCWWQHTGQLPDALAHRLPRTFCLHRC